VQRVALVALWVFLHNYNDKKSINVYLVNLLTVDLLLTLALPFKVAKDLGVDVSYGGNTTMEWNARSLLANGQ
jgi:hypothetical protein